MPPRRPPSERAPPGIRQGSSKDLESAVNAPPQLARSLPPPKAKRKRITPEQQEVLNKVFETTDTPNLELREQLSQQIGMTPREIQVYYQNQRAKRRRLARNDAAQAALAAASAAMGSPVTLGQPYGPPPAYVVPSGMVAGYPADAPPFVQQHAPEPAQRGRRRSLEDLLSPSPAAASPSEGVVRLPPLREVFPDLLPPLPANFQLSALQQSARASSASPSLRVPPAPASVQPSSATGTRRSSSSGLPEQEETQTSAVSTPPTTVE